MWEKVFAIKLNGVMRLSATTNDAASHTIRIKQTEKMVANTSTQADGGEGWINNKRYQMCLLSWATLWEVGPNVYIVKQNDLPKIYFATLWDCH